MREIIFRGKRKDTHEWVQGGYCEEADSGRTYIAFWNSFGLGFLDFTEVYPKSVGQYTGVNDINNVQMFEGDIVNVLIGKLSPFAEPVGFNAAVVFKDGAFGIKWNRGAVEEFSPFASFCNSTFTVIGNIHDNPEVLKGGAE